MMGLKSLPLLCFGTLLRVDGLQITRENETLGRSCTYTPRNGDFAGTSDSCVTGGAYTPYFYGDQGATEFHGGYDDVGCLEFSLVSSASVEIRYGREAAWSSTCPVNVYADFTRASAKQVSGTVIDSVDATTPGEFLKTFTSSTLPGGTTVAICEGPDGSICGAHVDYITVSGAAPTPSPTSAPTSSPTPASSYTLLGDGDCRCAGDGAVDRYYSTHWSTSLGYGLAECQNVCSSYSWCQAMQFGHGTGACYIYAAPHTDSIRPATITNFNSGQAFRDLNCEVTEVNHIQGQCYLKAVPTPSPTPLPTAAAPAGYAIAYSDTWCGDTSLYDATSGSTDAMLHTTVDSCAQKCNNDVACQFFVWGWNPSGYYRCATFTTCNSRHNYNDGDPNVYQKVSSGGAGGGATAVGDPHLQNLHGERFDLMKEGKHVLISIPRGMSVANALLYVQADARRLGGKCADMYFQELNITGAWAEAKQAGGYHYSISQNVVNTPEWVAFGKVEFKVVHGSTISGLRYLNLYVKHLGHAGYAVGGLLGEDDHSDVAHPPDTCRKKMSLLGLVA